jgi:hypothetical protein
VTAPDNATRELHDRLAIHRLVLAYCRAVDRGDFAGVRKVYAAEGRDVHTGFAGTADDYVAWLRGKLAQFDGTMHLIGNHDAELHGDRALAETYGTAVHWGTPAADPSRNFTSGFRYVDHLRRTADGWRIVERRAVREWTRSDAGRLVTPEGPGPRGTRDADDPLHLMRRLVSDAAELD